MFIDIIGKKFCTKVAKACIRRDYPPHIAEWKCHAIDMAEKCERIEWLAGMMRPDILWYQT